jgi:hypothetical protein
MSTSSKANHQGTESESVPPRLAALLLAPLLLLLALPVGAQNWVRMAGSPSGDVYLDATSVRVDAHMRRAWLMYDFVEPLKSGSRSILVLEEFDCKETRSRRLQSTSYQGKMGTGEVVVVNNEPRPWSFIAPRMNIAVILNAICP